MRRLALLALAGTLALAASGCGGGEEPDPAATPPTAPPPAPPPPPTIAPPTDAPSPAEPEAAREDPLAGTTLDGRPLGLADFRGEYLFVNVWSSW
jgi:hypothetical protein